MLASRGSDDVQSQSTSCSSDSRPMGRTNASDSQKPCLPPRSTIGSQHQKKVSLVTRAVYQQFQAYRPSIVESMAIPFHVLWRPSLQLRGTEIPTRDLRPLNNKNLKFLGVTAYGAVPQRPCPSRQIRQSDGSQNHLSFFAAPQPMSIGTSSSRSSNDDNDRNGTSMRRVSP
ncbi:hypothetical protein ARMGADRAFT_1079701 [Armillaria gallica]|uniref:Uncharacterized protein n=1 Tax=Armillaria gallica TaxID=47427 RepID=A0A2H3DDQ3_ARMGA|nr:hypothetical protein ARMGADRAFT_1079701 [Armillaria gallica]